MWIMENPNLNWRWTEYITLIISAAAFLFLPEIHLPTLLDWKARHLRRVTGHEKYISEQEEIATFVRRMKKILPMPITFFSSEPVILILGLYLVLLYILQFSFLSSFYYLFTQTYTLSVGQTGSCFGAITLGSTALTFAAPGLYSWAHHKTE
jgi:DHA1 family multidrug resistance protein-like MFS transporter